MSVINKMLRDLDHRANPSATALPGPTALRQGTASVGMDSAAPQAVDGTGASRMWLGLGLVVVAGLAFGGWWWSASLADGAAAPKSAAAPMPPPMANQTSSTSGTQNAMPAVVVASAPTPEASSPASSSGNSSADATYGPSVASVILRMEPSLSARKALDALLAAPAPAPAVVAVPPPAASARVAAGPSPAPSAPSTTAPASTPVAAATTGIPPAERASTRATTPKPAHAAASPGGDSTPVLQRQQQAGGDALAQAQALWSNGSRDAAMDLMQQSIAAAERSAKGGAPATAGNAVLLPLVREMARMQLAEARFGAVWEMLTRLEPLLGNPPDLWAIRANAAQRLGRHQDSVHAYMMALQSRPDEQRWLLGTAVSLAALGQTSSAAEMAEKARAIGPVGKDILAYLRQTGVPLREQ